MTERASAARAAVTLAVIAALYVAAARFGLSLAVATKQVTALWPPTGIAVAALALFGARVWPAIAVGAFVANAVSGTPIVLAAGIAIGNTLGPVSAVYALTRFVHFAPSLERTRDVLGLALIGAALGMAISATNGVTVLALGGAVPWSSFGSVWWVWWVGDAMGVLVVAPLLCTWAPVLCARAPVLCAWAPVLCARAPVVSSPGRPRRSRAGWGERAALYVGLTLVSVAVLVAPAPTAAPFQLQYAVFPFVLWAGLRFGPRETSLATAVITALAVWGAILERGPFHTGNLDQRLIQLELFIAVASVAGLTLSAVTAERTAAQRALQRAHDELEARVAERTAELARQYQRVEQAHRMKSEFLANMSHELRTPLNGIIGFVELLHDDQVGEVSSAQREFLADVLTSARHLLEQINGILELSRLDAGPPELRIAPLALGALVEEVREGLGALARRRAIEVSVELDADAAPLVTDAGMLKQILRCYLSNALKFTPERGRVWIRARAEGDARVRIEVEDTGIGIGAEDHAKLFADFVQLDASARKRYQGSGLGLALTRRLAAALGGEVGVRSELGRGSTFAVILPRVVAGHRGHVREDGAALREDGAALREDGAEVAARSGD